MTTLYALMNYCGVDFLVLIPQITVWLSAMKRRWSSRKQRNMICSHIAPSPVQLWVTDWPFQTCMRFSKTQTKQCWCFSGVSSKRAQIQCKWNTETNVTVYYLDWVHSLLVYLILQQSRDRRYYIYTCSKALHVTFGSCNYKLSELQCVILCYETKCSLHACNVTDMDVWLQFFSHVQGSWPCDDLPLADCFHVDNQQTILEDKHIPAITRTTHPN